MPSCLSSQFESPTKKNLREKIHLKFMIFPPPEAIRNPRSAPFLLRSLFHGPNLPNPVLSPLSDQVGRALGIKKGWSLSPLPHFYELLSVHSSFPQDLLFAIDSSHTFPSPTLQLSFGLMFRPPPLFHPANLRDLSYRRFEWGAYPPLKPVLSFVHRPAPTNVSFVSFFFFSAPLPHAIFEPSVVSQPRC